MENIDTSWSKLIDTPIGKVAKTLHQLDKRRKYHNWDHICRNIHHAKHTFNFEYDAALDLSNLFHDIVYDEHPDKELRSMITFAGIYEAMEPTFDHNVYDSARALIMDTVTHENVRNDERMILLDLADLGDPHQTKVNHGLIMDESVSLYNVDIAECARGGITYMSNLINTSKVNQSVSENTDYWDKIINGINQTIHLNEGIIARA